MQKVILYTFLYLIDYQTELFIQKKISIDNIIEIFTFTVGVCMNL